MEPRSSLSRRRLLELGGTLAVAGAVGLQSRESRANGAPETKAEIRPTRGGTFRLRIAQPPPHFDPHLTASAWTMIALSFTHSRLINVEPGPTIAPGTLPMEGDLADSWERKGDTVYVFKLRKGVRWHNKPPVNGRELVAQDVKYSFDRFLSTKGNPNAALLDMVEKVEALDALTVRFTLREPYAWFVDRLAATSTWIVARECVEKFGDLRRWESVVGTGPWSLERYEPNAKLHFTSNGGYYRTGYPYVDGVELTIDPDPVAAGAAFVAGKYDFGPEYGMAIRRTDLAAAKKRIDRFLPTREYLALGGSVTAMKLDQEPFKDVRVRRAIAMAENWRELIAQSPLAQGKGAPNPVVPAAMKEWSLSVGSLSPDGRRLYESDAAAARQQLGEAGLGGGLRVPLEAVREPGTEWAAAVQLAVKNLKAAGVDVDLKPRDAAGGFEKMLLAPRDGATALDPDVFLASLLPGHPLNTGGVNDPKLTEMVKAQRRTVKERARRDIVHEIQRACAERAYYAYGPSVSLVSAWVPWIKDFGPNIGHDYGPRLMVAWIQR